MSSAAIPTSPAIVTVDYGDDLLAILARQLLDEHRAALPLLDTVTVLVPEAEAAPRLRQLLLELAAADGHRALLGPQIMPLQEWVRSQPLTGQQVVSEHGRELMLVEALREHRTMFGHGNLWALADSLLELFDELTLNKVGLPQDLESFRRRLARCYGDDSSALQALTMEARVVHTLWQAWHQQLRARRLIDAPSAYLLQLAASLEATGEPGRRLYVAGRSRLCRAESQWLEQLLSQGGTTLYIYDSGAATTDGEDVPHAPYSDLLHQALHPQQQPLHQRSHEFAAQHPDSPLCRRLWLFAADGAEQEAQAVDLQVRRWLLEGRPSIAVVTENRRLARRVRALLERAGIALQDAAGWALSTTSAAAALERWLQCAEEDFPHQAMLDLLKSPFVFKDDERSERLADVYRLEQGVVLQGNIGRGLQRYRRQLQYRGHLLPPELAAEQERVAGLLTLLEHAVAPLKSLVTAGNHPPAKVLNALLESLRRLGLTDSFSADAAGARVLQVLDDMARATGHEPASMDWSEFRAWLGRTLERTNFRPVSGGAQVQLMGLEQSLLGRFDALIIAGAEQEHLPGNSAASPFFNQNVRRELGLPTQQQRKDERLQQFERLLHAAPQILLTLRRQQDGEEILPSPWVEGIRSFQSLAYGESLEDPILAGWLRQGSAQVIRCDTTELPVPPQRPAPALAPTLHPGTLTASGYQQLVDCPYQFYAARGLGLAPPEAIREALQKADYGDRVHQCLQAFHSGVRGLPGPFATTITPANRNEAITLLEQIAAAVFAQDLEDNFLHRAWLERWRAIIPAYIDWQTVREDQSWRVNATELALRREEFLPGLALKGRIDRIDQGTAGSAVLDYKTGHAASVEEVEQGEAVQLPFYAMLQESVPERVEYVTLRDKVDSTTVLEGEQLLALRDANEQRLRQVITDMRQGTPMPAWGDEQSCNFCVMSGICRRAMWIADE